MHLLYFWRRDVYAEDLRSCELFHLNQNSPRMARVRPGEHLWAFTRDSAGRYVLAADLVVTYALRNPPATRYGAYRVHGDLRVSRYFSVSRSPPAEELLRRIVSVRTPALGQSFQGPGAVREISDEAHQLLATFAKSLPLEPSVHGSSSAFYEARMLERPPPLAAESSARTLGVVDLPDPSMSAERRAFLLRRIWERDPQLVQQLQDIYDGRCQLCLWEPTRHFGARLCEAHHIHWLSQGGADALTNLLLVCPNHHRAIHATQAQLDFATMNMHFGERNERIQLNQHLPSAA